MKLNNEKIKILLKTYVIEMTEYIYTNAQQNTYKQYVLYT